MINFAQINLAVVDRFKRLIDNQRLAHAYLLVGPPDSGKTQTALSLAQMVNCEGPGHKPCGDCASCRKIANGNHPDVHVLGNDELDSLKIEDIRFLLNRAHLMAFEARTKVFIIRNIEFMTPEAANALLKTLEEPAANTLMLLTTGALEASLDTIKSRCHIVKFFPSSDDQVARMLGDEGIKGQDAHFWAVYTEGCLGQVRKLMKQEIGRDRRKALDQMLVNRQNDQYLKELSADPKQAAQALKLLLSFFRDVLLFKNGVGLRELVHQDCLDEITRFAKRAEEELAVIIRQIVQTKRLLDEKLNVKMSLSLLREHLWAN